MKFLILLALVAAASAQGNLDSFASVRDALLEGSELQLNANSAECLSSDPAEPAFLVSMPLRQWQVINNNGVETIRADDFYVSTIDPLAASFLVRTLAIRDDDTVTMGLTNTANATLGITLDCELAAGAVVHRVIGGNDLTVVDTYNEVKSLLLAGDHVEAVGVLGACSNAGEALPEGMEYTVGYQIVRFSVNNDGTSDEFLAFDDVAVIAISNETESISAETVVIRPDGSAEISIGIWTPDLSEQLNNITLTCSLGSALRFTIHNRENEDTFTTYTDIKTSTLDGHDMELVVFLEFCDTTEGEAIDFTGMIGGLRFDQFQLFEAGGMWGDVEYIAYSSYGIGVSGYLYADVVRVNENDVVEIEYFVVSPGSGAEGSTGTLSCPLVDAALFHAVRRARAPVTSFQEIVNEIQTQGQTFEVEIDYSGCDLGNATFGSTYGGIVWQTYIDPSLEDGYYFGSVFALVQQNITGTPAPAWDASSILLQPDNSVLINPRLYDYFTGENLIADLGTEPIECSLAPEGSVTFFRYP